MSESVQLKAVGGKLAGTFVPPTTGCIIIILNQFGEYYLTMFSSMLLHRPFVRGTKSYEFGSFFTRGDLVMELCCLGRIKYSNNIFIIKVERMQITCILCPVSWGAISLSFFTITRRVLSLRITKEQTLTWGHAVF